MTKQSKRPVGRPETGKTVQFHTVTLPIGLLDKVKELNPGFKLSGFVEGKVGLDICYNPCVAIQLSYYNVSMKTGMKLKLNNRRRK